MRKRVLLLFFSVISGCSLVGFFTGIRLASVCSADYYRRHLDHDKKEVDEERLHCQLHACFVGQALSPANSGVGTAHNLPGRRLVEADPQWARAESENMNQLPYRMDKSRREAVLAALRKRWARHGSTRWLWEPEHVSAAVRYAVDEQGEAMAVFEAVEG